MKAEHIVMTVSQGHMQMPKACQSVHRALKVCIGDGINEDGEFVFSKATPWDFIAVLTWLVNVLCTTYYLKRV